MQGLLLRRRSRARILEYSRKCIRPSASPWFLALGTVFLIPFRYWITDPRRSLMCANPLRRTSVSPACLNQGLGHAGATRWLPRLQQPQLCFLKRGALVPLAVVDTMFLIKPRSAPEGGGGGLPSFPPEYLNMHFAVWTLRDLDCHQHPSCVDAPILEARLSPLRE